MITRSFQRTRVLRALSAALLALGTHHAAAQTIVAGPVYNPASGSRYYMIQTGTYTQLRAFAVGMGGDLATINDSAENTFLASNFAQTTKPFIGLNDATTEGTFAWSDGSTAAFRKWRAGEPSNTATKDFVRLAGPSGEWEVVTSSFSAEAIVEINATDPVRVPQERFTIEAALAVLPSIGINRVLVAPGDYVLLNSVEVSGADVSGSGMGVTTFQAPFTFAAFQLYNDAVLRNATIVNRSNRASVLVMGGSARVSSVEFTSLPGNADDAYLDMNSTDETAFIESCIFAGAESAIDANTGSVRVINSIFRDLNNINADSGPNRDFFFTNCVFTRVGPSDLFTVNGNYTITNSIFFNNPGDLGAFVNMQYSLLPSPYFGTGNKVGDPLFVNAPANDFTLQPTSPAIDAGSITLFAASLPEDILDFNKNPRATDAPLTQNVLPLLSPIDMGPLEFQPPTPIDTCKPDFNDDGFIDDTDFVTFAQFYDLFTCP